MDPVLIVEDQPAVAKALALLLELGGISCQVAGNAADALRALGERRVAVMIQDMNFSPGATEGAEGLALFRAAREKDPGLPVLALTAWTSVERAVQMMKEGAADYLAKPWKDEQLLSTVRELLQIRVRPPRATVAGLPGLVCASAAMERVVALALQVADADVPVLITGPAGVGKEMVAELIQSHSPRSQQPFVRVNAGALPEQLVESELFGVEAGAYTGAVKRRLGRFEAAHRGTLFLDEIGNLSRGGQAKLLRVLQSGELERLGSSETRRVDVRILAATNADLRAEMAAGRFREDLFFRLNVIGIAIPPLAERREDILPLAEHFLARSSTRPWRLSERAKEALHRHEWPGNVRELANCMQRATLVASGEVLEPEDLGLGSFSAGAVSESEPAGPRQQIEAALREAGGQVSLAAERLGMSRQALYRKMDRLGIVLERVPR